MGENGVYREQFYTKLVSSCSCTYTYATFLFENMGGA